MRTLVSSVLLLFTYLASTAQPVIESSSYINANTVLFLESAAPLWLAEQDLTTQSGEDQEWDLTDWESVLENTQSYYPLEDVPPAYQIFFNNDFLYPEHISTHGLLADLDAEQAPLPVEVSDPFAFYRTDETGYYSTGTAFTVEGIPIVTQNDSIERILPFPLTYELADTSAISFITQVPFFGVFGQSGLRTTEVDGWGILETPYGEYDVLRVRSERSVVDTLYIEQTGTGETIERPVEIQYSWISANVPGPVLTITTVEDIAISASLYAEDGVLSTESVSLAGKPLFFPNPAGKNLYINPQLQIESLTIYDMSGIQVAHKSLPEQSGISLEAMPSGVYLIVAQDKRGNTFRDKLIIE